jgi:hypothetical protein
MTEMSQVDKQMLTTFKLAIFKLKMDKGLSN